MPHKECHTLQIKIFNRLIINLWSNKCVFKKILRICMINLLAPIASQLKIHTHSEVKLQQIIIVVYLHMIDSFLKVTVTNE